MGRSTKQGIEYYPLDTSFDQKIQMLILEKGPVALAVLVTIWQLIYGDEGYFTHYSEDLLLLLKQRILVEPPQGEDIIKAALDRNIFDKPLFSEHNILTSRAIQKRYFIAAKRKKEIIVCKNYLCSGVIVCENVIYNTIDGCKKTTKEKEKEKEKEEEKEEEKKDIPPTIITWSVLKEKYLPKYVSFARWFLLKQKEQFPNQIKEEIRPGYSRVKDSIDVLDKLCRIDKFNFEKEVEPILKKATDDPFWAKQILSLASLRNKSPNGEIKFVNLTNTLSSETKKAKSNVTIGYLNKTKSKYSC